MSTTKNLIVCIGNVARGDDGVAHRVADLLRERLNESAAHIITAPDLDVAMAADVAGAERFILVDAERRRDPFVLRRALEPGPATRPTGHGIDPAGLLGISQALYGASPPAELWSVAAPEMGHGEELSATAAAAAVEAAAALVLDIESRSQR